MNLKRHSAHRLRSIIANAALAQGIRGKVRPEIADLRAKIVGDARRELERRGTTA